MNVFVSQIYCEAGASYPFGYRFQMFLSGKLSELVQPSEIFIGKYGKDFNIIFRMTAGSELTQTIVLRPTVYKKHREVEYFVVLPFDRSRPLDDDAMEVAVRRLLLSIIDVLENLGIDTHDVSGELESLSLMPRGVQIQSWRMRFISATAKPKRVLSGLNRNKIAKTL